VENQITIEDMVMAPGVRETASEDGAILSDIEQRFLQSQSGRTDLGAVEDTSFG
jgi:hypothetical protein